VHVPAYTGYWFNTPKGRRVAAGAQSRSIQTVNKETFLLDHNPIYTLIFIQVAHFDPEDGSLIYL
jgi:hypothetical protein